MRTLTIVAIALVMGCGCKMHDNPEDWVREAPPPVTISAMDDEGNVVLQDGNGEIKVYPGRYYFSKALAASRKVGDIIKEAK